MDGTAFEHYGSLIVVNALNLEHFGGNTFVKVTREVQAVIKPTPCIEDPVNAAQVALTIYNKGRTAISHPGVIVGNFYHAHIWRQHAARIFKLGWINPHYHRLK